MSYFKTTLASSFYIIPPTGTTYTFTPAGQPSEIEYKTINSSLATSTGFGIQPSIHVKQPGVFTAGTAQEGTLSNPTNDSNS
jgi:hypothetical protein